MATNTTTDSSILMTSTGRLQLLRLKEPCSEIFDILHALSLTIGLYNVVWSCGVGHFICFVKHSNCTYISAQLLDYVAISNIYEMYPFMFRKVIDCYGLHICYFRMPKSARHETQYRQTLREP